MGKKSIGLKLLGIFFILMAIVSIIHIISIIEPLFASRNPLFIAYTTSYTTLYATISFITAIGIFRLKPWARKLAVILLVFKMIQITISLVKDLNIMIKNSVGMVLISSAVGLIIAVIAIMVFLIVYLNRASIKEQFKRNEVA